jgi:hypothetical protein
MEQSRVQKAFYGLIALALLGLGGWAFVRAAIDQPAVLGTVVTVVGAFLGVQWQQRRTEKDALAQKRREQISPTYQELIEWLRDPDERDETFFVNLQNKLLLFGPAPVLQAWASGLRVTEKENPETSIAPVVALAGIIMAVRADLGHEDGDLSTRDLLRVFVNDIDEHLPA